MGRVLLERTKKYLFIPYEEGTVDQKIQIRDKSKKEFSFYYPIASSHVSGWGRIELPIEMVGETVEIITERDAMIEAIYTREQCYGLVERHPMEPWIHFHIPFGKILSVKSLYQDGKENWRMYLLEDFSMGLQSNKGMIREYESKDLYYWKEVRQEISDFRIADNTEKFPLIGDVEEFIRATDKNGDTYGFALSKTFRLEQSPVTNVLSIQQKINKDTILHYGSMLLGAAVLSFGLFNVHSQSKITEGGILGLTLFLHHWTGISPGIFSFLLDMTCYIIGFQLLGTDFLKNAIFSTCCYALLYRFWEFTGPFLPSYADKPLIAAILGGLFVGIGAGLIVRRGGASGGDDALALILHQVTGWKISRSYFFTDFVVLMLSISYIPLRNIFFSLLTVTLSSAVIELLQKSGQKATAEESGRESSWKD